MKKLRQCALYAGLVLLSLVSSCSTGTEADGAPESGVGEVIFNPSCSAVVDQITKSGNYELDADLIPAVGDFTLSIEGSYIDSETGATIPYAEQMLISEIPSTGIILHNGNYTATITWGDELAEGVDAVSFSGKVDFRVLARTTITVDISAQLNKSAIALTTSEWFNKYYPTVVGFQVATFSEGEQVSLFDFTGSDESLYFVRKSSQLKLSGEAVTTQGKSVKFEQSDIFTTTTTTAECTRYNILVDAKSASEGGVMVSLNGADPVALKEVMDFNPNNQ